MHRRLVTILLILSLLTTLFSLGWMGIARQPLVIPGKTNALLSLETAFTQQRVYLVREAWSNQLAYAERVNNIDFLFVFSYTLFFLFSVFFLHSAVLLIRVIVRTLLAMILITFVFDIFEGVASHYWLLGEVDRITPPLVGCTAILKFVFAGVILLFLVAGYLQWAFWKLKTSNPPYPKKLPG